MKRTRWNPRKVLVASAGVATVNYVLAIGCDGNSLGNVSSVANLMPAPGGVGGSFSTVANLVAPPLDLSPPPVEIVGGTGGTGPLDAGQAPSGASAPDANPPDAAARSDAGNDAGEAAPPDAGS